MTIKTDTFFLIPTEFANIETNTFCLMPDNNDCLPIERLSGSICWSGYIYDSKLSSLSAEGEVIPRSCILFKTQLSTDTIISIKTQTTEFMSLDTFEYIEKLYPEVGEIIMKDAHENLTMNTVNDLQIKRIYAGRNKYEVVWLWPELENKFANVIIGTEE